MKKKIIQFIGSILICLAPGIVGGLFTVQAIPQWYSTINKPFFNPPSWIFGPVWTVLYLMMGIALFLIWKEKSEKKLKQKAIIIFVVQLFLNAAWSPAFFGLHSPLLGLAIIIPLWVSILLTIRYFGKISKNAAFLLAPYILWVSFATVLNFAIWWMNR